MFVAYVTPICNVVELGVEGDSSGCGVIRYVVAVCVNVGGGPVFDMFRFGMPFDFGGVGGFVVLGVYAFEEVVPHVAVVL